MKFFITILLIYLLNFSFAQEPVMIKTPNLNSPIVFPHFLDEVEKLNSLKVFYKEEWIKHIMVTNQGDSIELVQFLDKLLLFEKVGYYFSAAGNLYLIPDKTSFIREPLFHQAQSDSIATPVDETGIQQYLSGGLANSDTTIVIGKPRNISTYEKVTIHGKIVDAIDGEPLVGVTLYIRDINLGASTNASGIVEMKLKPGVYAAELKSVGMSDHRVTFRVNSGGNFTVLMFKANHALGEVIVSGQITKRGSAGGLESVDYLTMKEIPLLLGEKDVIKIAQMLPGIVSVGEGSGGINVRGGNADQNLFYINNIPIYNSAHLFGFFSSINSSIVDRFTVYKGMVPVEFGGRLSSVFDIATKKGNTKKFYTEGSLSPIAANLSFEIPVQENKTAVTFSARSTYSNWILGQMDDPDLRNSKASFNDFSLGVETALNEQSKLSMMAYLSNDRFSLSTLSDYSYGNRGGVINYSVRPQPVFKIDAYLIHSQYGFSSINKTNVSESYEHEYSIKHSELKAIAEWKLHTNHTLKFGGNSILYHLNRGEVLPYGLESNRMTIDLGREKGLETALFLSDQLELGSRASAYAGLRYAFFYELGPKTVMKYRPNLDKTTTNIIDSVSYSNNQLVSFYNGPEVRLAFDYKTSPNGSLKLSFTQMQQFLFMLSNTISIAPTDQWKLVDSHLKPMKSILYSIGYFHQFPARDMLFSAELYRKRGSEMVEYKDGVDFLNTPQLETVALQGKQNAYGAELMLSKDEGSLSGWITYTYSRTVVEVDGEHYWQKINNGKPYASNYDKPHVLNMVVNLKLNRRYSISSNIVYSTGRPVTLPVGYYYLEGQPYIDYSSRNEYRMPDYFRTDLSVKIEGNLKRNKPAHSYWMISVYNLLGRDNANSIYFQSENGLIRGYQYAVVGVPIYTISWNWKLGNYASK
jgi:hypothetical protein